MIPARSPEELLDVADALAERGASGFLLSGGVDSNGKIKLLDFADAIGEIKSTTDLVINTHVGLTPKAEIDALVRSGVDAFSVDVYGDDVTIHEVTGLKAGAEDYLRVCEDLISSGAPIVAPHVCIGIRGGELAGERRAIERLRRLEPRSLVLISLIPTKGTQYEHVLPPSGMDIVGVISKAREELPDTKILLGCMRSKRDRSWEFEAVQAGLDGIVMPSEGTVERIKHSGGVVRKRSVCCALI
jgi:uncharacterized radical SAM superfamily protein